MCVKKLNNDINRQEVPSNVQETVFTPRSGPLSNVAPLGVTEEDVLEKTPPKESQYKYYCPLCFLWRKDHTVILKSICCGHNICVDCTMEYLKSKGLETNSKSDIISPSSQPYLEHVACPNCNSTGFQPKTIRADERTRNYFPVTPTPSVPNATCTEGIPEALASPVKVGDNFEALKRKMYFDPTPARISASNQSMAEPETEADNGVSLQSEVDCQPNSPITLRITTARSLSEELINDILRVVSFPSYSVSDGSESPDAYHSQPASPVVPVAVH